MDAQQFIAEFGHIANAPGGISQLRKLVLDLAIRGALLPPRDYVSDASTLLAEVATYRDDLVRTGKLRRPAPQPPIDERELTFSIPDGWAFERLGNVCEIVRGVTFPASKKQTSQVDGTVACLRTSNVQVEVDWSDLIYIDADFVGREDQWVQAGDTMISMANSYELVGKVALVKDVRQPATFGGFIAAVRPHILEPNYLYLLLRSHYMQARMRATASQTTNIANISLGGMRPIPTPFPPKEEQSRIVAKVDELMALCDQLEAQQQSRRQLQTALRRATLQALASTQTPHDLQIAWTRLADNFGQLFDAPEDLDELRKSILTLAVQGKLVPQDSSDEAVERLFEKLEVERKAFAERHQYRAAASQPLNGNDVPYGIPASWKWCRLNSLFNAVTDGDHLPPPKSDSGVAFLTIGNITTGKLNFNGSRFVPEDYYQALADFRRPVRGDILYTVVGATYGRAVLVDTDRHFCVQRHIAILKPPQCMDVGYLMAVLRSSLAYEQATGSTTGTAQPTVPLGALRNFAIPLPPLAEQQRIVVRVAELMRYCDDIESKLRDANKLAERVATAAVSSLTGIAIEPAEEPVKAPKTELFAPLHLGGKSPSVKEQAPLAAILAHTQGGLNAKDLWRRYGGEIDAFYAQLKTEVTSGWIREPEPAVMNEIHEDDRASA